MPDHSDRMSTHDKYPYFIEDQSGFFDELVTADWDTYESAFWDKTRTWEINRLFKHCSPATVIDLGCGVGFHDMKAAEQPGVKEVVGVDYSAESVATANREYPHSKVVRRVANLFELPAADFDLAFSFQVIEHLTDPDKFLQICRSQVRPGGWVAIGTPNRKRLSNRLLKLLGRQPQLQDPHHFMEFTPKELARIAEGAGLTHVKTITYGMSIVLPKIKREAVSNFAYLPLGRTFKPIANLFFSIYRA